MATIQVYVNDEIKAAVKWAAVQEKRSVSFLIREWIEEKLKRQMPQVPSQVPFGVKIEEPQSHK